MLVLSRKPGERVVIVTPDGREIAVMVVKVERWRVRLGVEAPRDVKVHRDGPPPAPAEGRR